jgi:uncharacterized protein (DUF736 family)
MQQNSSSTTHQNPWSKKKIGALWIKKTKDGRNYLTGIAEIKLADGSIQKVPIAIYKNDFKKDQSPDFNIYQMDVL